MRKYWPNQPSSSASFAPDHATPFYSRPFHVCQQDQPSADDWFTVATFDTLGEAQDATMTALHTPPANCADSPIYRCTIIDTNQQTPAAVNPRTGQYFSLRNHGLLHKDLAGAYEYADTCPTCHRGPLFAEGPRSTNPNPTDD